MKVRRPLSVWLITAWCLICFVVYCPSTLTLFFQACGLSRDVAATAAFKINAVVFILMIVNLVLLVQLFSFARWTTIPFLLAFLLCQVIGFMYWAHAGRLTPPTTIFGAVFVLATVASIWALARPSFGRLCRECRAQRKGQHSSMADINEELLKQRPNM